MRTVLVVAAAEIRTVWREGKEATVRVPWEQVKSQFEDMVAVLIKREHPDAVPVNGSGGDDGRDVILNTANGLVIYEMKSFTGRLADGGRKPQIIRSLTKAAKHKPVQWYLVMPRNGTSGELDWFDGITGKHPFPCTWLDKAWLDSMMAAHPEIPRYFLEHEDQRLLRLWSELKDLPDQPGDAQATLMKARQLRGMLNTEDPYFEYGLHLGGATSSPDSRAVLSVAVQGDRIDVIPRYCTALTDRPITVDTTFNLGPHDGALARRFEDALRFGDPIELPPEALQGVTLDAPAGLGGTFNEVSALFIAGLDQGLDPGLLLEARVLAPDDEGSILASLDLVLTTRRSGVGGVVLRGKDDTGLLQVELRLDTTTRAFTVMFTYSLCNVLPEKGEKVGAWMAMVAPPNLLQMRFPANGTAADPEPISAPLAEGDIEAMFRGFRRLQERAGVRFEIPADLTQDELHQVHHIALMLEPDRSRRRWDRETIGLTLNEPSALSAFFEPPGRSFLIEAESLSFVFRGSQCELGRYSRHFEALAVGSRPSVGELDPGGGPVEIELNLEPSGSGVMTEWLET